MTESDRPENGLAEQLFVVDRDQLRDFLEGRRAESSECHVDVTSEGRFRVEAVQEYSAADIAEALRERGHPVPNDANVREAEKGAIALVWTAAL